MDQSHAHNSVAFSHDGKWALSGSDDKTVRLWDCKTDKLICGLKFGYYIKKVLFLPDGKEILVLTSQSAIQRWQLIDAQGNFRPMLRWSTGAITLSAENLNLVGAKDLSESNHRLLIQHGAIASPQNQAPSQPSSRKEENV